MYYSAGNFFEVHVPSGNYILKLLSLFLNQHFSDILQGGVPVCIWKMLSYSLQIHIHASFSLTHLRYLFIPKFFLYQIFLLQFLVYPAPRKQSVEHPVTISYIVNCSPDLFIKFFIFVFYLLQQSRIGFALEFRYSHGFPQEYEDFW